MARRHKERRSSGEGTPPDDDASTSSEEEPSTGKEEASSGKEQTGGSSRGLKGRSVSGTGEGEAAFLEMQGPSLSREGSRLMARLRLKREMRHMKSQGN